MGRVSPTPPPYTNKERTQRLTSQCQALVAGAAEPRLGPKACPRLMRIESRRSGGESLRHATLLHTVEYYSVLCTPYGVAHYVLRLMWRRFK